MNGMRIALWGTAAVVAAAVATAGVAVATMTGNGGTVLSQHDVDSQLASDETTAGTDDPSAETSGTAMPDPSASAAAGVPAPDGPGTTAIVQSRAGTLAVRCAGDQIVLDRWSPKSGYRSDDVRRTATRVSVLFESDTADDVEAVVTCSAGQPVLTENVQIDDHGSQSGGGGSGRR